MAPGPFVEPYRHIENPDPKRRFYNLLAVSGLLDRLVRIAPRRATDNELLRVHTPTHLDRVKTLSAGNGGDTGVNARIAAGGFEIAALSAGGAITAVEAVLDGTVRNAYVLTRPPGHHAEPDRGMGFCIFANGAIAARHALATQRVGRIAFVDWDVHHGNGTQRAFYDDPRVLTISIHQEQCFPPDQGGIEEIGVGPGTGYNLNIPLPPGCGEGAYRRVFERIVLPALNAFAPDLIFVISGYDAGIFDPLGRMMLHAGAFRRLGEIIREASDSLCRGRLILLHEGGYCPATVPFFALAVLEELAGVHTGVVDPLYERHRIAAGQALQPHQSALIDTLAETAESIRATHWRNDVPHRRAS
jgi:acetoin utilization deacetylase AcuC-like enzyme